MTRHLHDFVPGKGHNQPCRICVGDDDGEILEQLAADLWESRRNGHLDDRPWADAGSHWQMIYREFAVSALASLRTLR